MSANRIELPSKCFLLYTNLLLYCIKVIKTEAFESLLSRLANEIPKQIGTDQNTYLGGLASTVNNIDELRCLYGKITTEIKKQGRPIVAFNSTSEIAACFRFIERVYPEECAGGLQIFISKHLNKAIGEEFKGKEEFTSFQSPSQKLSWIDSLINTAWYFYYHEYDNSPKTRLTIISRLVLEIVNPNQVFLYEKKEALDFTGTIDQDSSTNSIIVINLVTKNSNAEFKKLQLRIIPLEGVSSKSIFLGQYMDGEAGNKIVSGTFVLENVKGHVLDSPSKWVQTEDEFTRIREININTGEKLQVIRLDLIYYTGWERFIPKYIADFLSHKGKNHTKINPKVSDYESLRDFLKDQRGKPEKYNTKIEYDMLIVTPIGNIKEIEDKTYYKEINNSFFKHPQPTNQNEEEGNTQLSAYDATDLLKKHNIKKIYYAPRVVIFQEQHVEGDIDSETIINNEISAMKSSRIIIFILPKQEIVNTSFFIKVGWAMMLDRPTIIFPLDVDLLPRLIDKPHIGKSIWITAPTMISQIPARIVADYIKAIHM